MVLRILIVLLLFSFGLEGQRSVGFMELDLESAKAMAKRQNKGIFIDTYASYCKPCKIQEVEFRNAELASYLNDNFINVKVNMEGPKAKLYSLQYHIVFLPTLLFLNSEGQLTLKIDHLVSAKDLLKFAMQKNGEFNPPEEPAQVELAVSPELKPKANQESIQVVVKEHKPMPPSAIPVAENATEEKILYVMGDDNLPPEILREEAYFRLQLMDGSHHDACSAYLRTQDDWTSEVNMRFIFDFLHSTKSGYFKFFISHLNTYYKLLGKEEVDKTISILINKELERGYPRPDYKRAKELYSYLYPEHAELMAKDYITNRTQ